MWIAINCVLQLSFLPRRHAAFTSRTLCCIAQINWPACLILWLHVNDSVKTNEISYIEFDLQDLSSTNGQIKQESAYPQIVLSTLSY